MKIGVIGLGDMGRLFARIWSQKGFDVYGCDVPGKEEELQRALPLVKILPDAVAVSRSCDVIMYAVETEKIEEVLRISGPSTKYGAIVTGQTSVKTPEIKAFERHLPADAQIVGSHALFGPSISPDGQIIAMYRHRCEEDAFEAVKQLYLSTGAMVEELESYKHHDQMMADIQVITHVGFESLGTAFMHRKAYPWEDKSQVQGIDNIKLLLTLRIFSYKPHVYSGLAFENPFAIKDVRKFARIENELFGLMITENKNALASRVLKARDKVFGERKAPYMLDDKLMREYTLNPGSNHKPNSHLSLLTMVCTWADLGIDPYKNMVCQTPPFRLRVGLAEYLFTNPDLLEESLKTAVKNKDYLIDDLAYHTAVHEWTNILELGDKKAYEKQFLATSNFLGDRLEEGRDKSTHLLNRLIHEGRA
ncbi:Prephenate dehydrogenase (NADP(+)) [Leadbetterella byssophila DSM 17132]|uniref:Prephenate dehydrogenase (NADP(+)) n=1 Tax=Leadbetterella byssophila (strain DSM 17132 / JCM 16389 / KACC 11308 / NBRC 106382 / 4M15) TaxID=649349 RepID=E4RUA2_LEAB4|nr:prephenate dehydrogenase [Leadbetterella byssophila]ADQ16936.1 Prephenate dehydrogenase (NADP(+)) [Leadbetterella byssophila DSM 17132]